MKPAQPECDRACPQCWRCMCVCDGEDPCDCDECRTQRLVQILTHASGVYDPKEAE